MVRKFRKGSSKRNQSLRKSQAWRYLSRRNNADNFEGRTVLVGGKGLDLKDQPDSSNTNQNNEDKDKEDLQVHFVDNTIKSSKYTIWTFIPRCGICPNYISISNIP